MNELLANIDIYAVVTFVLTFAGVLFGTGPAAKSFGPLVEWIKNALATTGSTTPPPRSGNNEGGNALPEPDPEEAFLAIRAISEHLSRLNITPERIELLLSPLFPYVFRARPTPPPAPPVQVPEIHPPAPETEVTTE